MIPSEVVGAGNNSIARNVFKVTFSQATTNIPKLEAWDDENFNSYGKVLFTGTEINGYLPMISAVATTDSAPNSDWKPIESINGGATINRLLGDVNYVNLASAPITGGGYIRFNINYDMTQDFPIPPNKFSDHAVMFTIRYSYSGVQPILVWYFNDEDEDGTEVVPIWTELIIGITGSTIRPANNVYVNYAGNPSIFLTKPITGMIDIPKIWVI